MDRRPDPDLLLRQVQAEELRDRRGRLKVFLGYSSGVGKTFTMLDEGRRRSQRGEDIVVGALQSQRPPEAEPVLASLEAISTLQVNGCSVLDVASILKRHPKVCLVDGLAYNNPPGSRHEYRWQDVEELLAAGISVVTTINLQYVEEYSDRVFRIVGKRVSQTVPLAFIHSANEIELVDTPAGDALQNLDPHAQESTQGHRALRENQYRALRELALLAAADVVDRQLESYLERNGVVSQWGTQERILVCITPRSDASQMIASGRRNAERFHGELIAVHVQQESLSAEDQVALQRNLDVAKQAGARMQMLTGEEPIEAILAYAIEQGTTQIFIGHTQQRGWWKSFWGGPVDRLIRNAEGIDIQVFPS